jgi:ABC-type nitrate/sulfonate/bicarbonate transport system substrate-binding protein
MKKIIVLSMALIFLLLAGTLLYILNKNSLKKELTPVSVQFYWLHTVEFAGFYMAEKLGYYEEAGLDVKFKSVDFDKKPTEQVALGESQFGVVGQDEILMAKEKGLSIKALAAIFQQPPHTFISLKDKNITTPEHLKGKRVAIECGITTELFQRTFIRNAGINQTEYTDVCSNYEISQLINNTIDVMAGFIENEPALLELQGFKVNNILLSDYGFFMYPNVIFTTDEMIKNNPELVRIFLQATIKGYEYAIEHTEEAVNETLKYDTALDLDHQNLSMEKQIPLINSGKHSIGWIDKTSWDKGYETLKQIGVIKKEIGYHEVVDVSYLNKND